VVDDPSIIFDDIVDNPEIVKRAETVTRYYDLFIEMCSQYSLLGVGTHQINGKQIEVSLSALKRQLYLTVASVNALEAVRFYVSFACSFAFAERAIMEGNAKVIKLIARDEALHLAGTQHMLNLMANGQDDPEMVAIAASCKDEVIEIFREAAEQERDWAKYLFKDGSMIGLNAEILSNYVDYITNIRLRGLGFDEIFEVRSNPLPWMNAWLVSDNVQVAPQEAEISSYLVGAIDSNMEDSDFDDFDL
jgi:ribonucleoside-diphosphate reductase beta chain